MSKTISIRVAHRSSSKSAGQRRHDTRKSPVPKYVDQSRSDQNSVIIKPAGEAQLRHTCEERRAGRETKRAMRCDAAISTAGIITFGRDAQPVVEALSIEEQDALYLRIAERLAAELKTDLTGLVVHRDEAAPHGHFQMPAVDRDGQPLSQTITPTVARRLQDLAGEEVAHLGIERGVSRAIREARGDDRAKVIHRSVMELHEALPREIEAAQARKLAIEQEVAALEAKRANNERLAEKARQNLEDGKGREEALQKRLAVYEERARKAEERAKANIAELEARNSAAARATADIWRLTDALADAFKHVDPDLSKELQEQAKIPTAPDLYEAVRMACRLRNTLNTPHAEQVIKQAVAHAQSIQGQEPPQQAMQPRRAQEKGKGVEI